ncbi:serine protease 40-like [Thomomys bottae]
MGPMGNAGGQRSGLSGTRAWALLAVLLSLGLQWSHAHPIQPTSSLSEVCGRTPFYGKIFGGQKAAPERWPWQASLLFQGIHICGAALIDKNWVASAAHCFQKSKSPSDYRILLGYNQLSNPTNYSLQKTVYKLFVHQDYDKYSPQGSDIVLLQLHTPVVYNSHVLPVCIPSNTTKLLPDRACWTSGWGMVTEDRNLPEPRQLQEAELYLMENIYCAAFFPPLDPSTPRPYAVKDDMVCAANFRHGLSICRGDSGGPLVCPVDGSWYLVGITSWSVPCYPPVVTPSVFARVSYFFDWIQDKKQNSDEPEFSSIPPEQPPPSLTDSPNHGLILRPSICLILLSSQGLLLQLHLLRSLR